jgi:hypothetical protein
MVRDMASCLAAKAAPAEPEPTEGGAPPAPAPQAKPISGGKLFLSLLWERIARLFRRRER